MKGGNGGNIQLSADRGAHAGYSSGGRNAEDPTDAYSTEDISANFHTKAIN